MKKSQIVILGAGNGTRMKSHLPKVLIPVKGKPMVERLLEMSIQSGLTKKPIVVVSKKNQKQIKEALGKKCFYALQAEQLGTGHAVFCAKKLLEGKYENVIVLNGDHPFITAETLKNLASFLTENKKMLAVSTTKVPRFSGWHETFFDFGRIIRNKKGSIVEIVEKKDATKQQLAIKEVNAAYYCFNTQWLLKHLARLKNHNSQGEYYLTDIIKLAIKNKQQIPSCSIDPKEALGINNPEQLAFTENFLDI